MPYQGQGFAVGAMFGSLLGEDIETITAHINPDPIASQHVAAKMGLVTGRWLT